MDFIDPGEKETISEDSGNIVITKLFGRGTPFVKYTGISDFIVHSDKKCDCGLHTPLIKKIEGRRVDSIILPTGEIITPLSVTRILHTAIHRLHTDKIQQFQIIQHNMKELDVLIVIDEHLRKVGPTVNELFEEIRREYMKSIGNGIKINVREVDKIKTARARSPTPPPVVISKVRNTLIR